MRRASSIIAAVGLLLAALVNPVSAAPQTVLDPLFIAFPDPANGKAVFWNITRDDLCAWEASGFAGPPPVTELIPVTINETPPGAIVARFQATAHLELWQLDADADLSGACTDTDDSTAPWAVGTARVSGNDNNLILPGGTPPELNRSNPLGDRGHGTIIDVDGNQWNYSWTFHIVLDKNGELVNLIDRASLRQR